jgi:hypothetical protein
VVNVCIRLPADMMDFVVSVPVEGAQSWSGKRVTISGRAERRYSEFEAFALTLSQLRSVLVRLCVDHARASIHAAMLVHYNICLDRNAPALSVCVRVSAPD